MNKQQIANHLREQVNKWADTLPPDLARQVSTVVIIAGGSLGSLITDTDVNDYDVYLRSRSLANQMVCYYASVWEQEHPGSQVRVVTDGGVSRVSHTVAEVGLVQDTDIIGAPRKLAPDREYSPVCITHNAITLGGRIQVVTRFAGDTDEILRNFDFLHCTCSWSSATNQVYTPSDALMSIINHELVYIGSRYPLCSVIRADKYVRRGYTCAPREYLKMLYQVSQLDLTNIEVLSDQLAGVDTVTFSELIQQLVRYTKGGHIDPDRLKAQIERL